MYTSELPENESSMQTISSLVPNAEDLLALEVEEVAGVLLVHLNSYSGRSSAVNNGLISDHNFFMTEPEYPVRQPEVKRALIEAWSWLVAEGFLVRHPEHCLRREGVGPSL